MSGYELVSFSNKPCSIYAPLLTKEGLGEVAVNKTYPPQSPLVKRGRNGTTFFLKSTPSIRGFGIGICTYAAILCCACLMSSCDKANSTNPKVIVIGFDGMDPRLCERLMDAGELPNLAKMRAAGGYTPLGTSIPPQSPVAWASFITGANPGVHGIFDFIHRDPSKQYSPYYSAAKTENSGDGWEVGEHKLPLTFWPFNHAPTQTLLKRDGKPFWDYLDEANIPTWFYDIPANYPPSPSKHGHMCCLSGMGVPDLHGTYGTYQHFSEITFIRQEKEGGIHHPLDFKNHAAIAKLVGPENTALIKPAESFVEFEIFRHPTQSSARIEIQDHTIVLNEGEWSEWQKVDFELSMPAFLPNSHVSGIVKFYLQQVHPHFKLYTSPINIDPSDPGDQKITEPDDFVTKIYEGLGLFYTAGFQEDHNALSNEVLSDSEYQLQAKQVLNERLDLLAFALEQYEDGLLFFYFSSTDLQAHMFWWDGDEKHPKRSMQDAKKYNQVVIDIYKQMDAVVGDLVEQYGKEATIMLMSDHGFCNFRRQFNLNTWLRDNGYIQPPNTKSFLIPSGTFVDWTKTRAYGLGLNGLYLNLQGRERDGIVTAAERDALLNEISEKLLLVRDLQNGQPVIKEVYRSQEVYSGANVEHAPDLIVGYYRGYRASWSTTMGHTSAEVISDNSAAWSADHCIAADEVPGVLFSNRPISHPNPSLTDMAPTILSLFDVEIPTLMEGKNVFQSETVSQRN